MNQIQPTRYPENRWPANTLDYDGGRLWALVKLGNGNVLEIFAARIGSKGDSALFLGVLGKGCKIFDKKVKAKEVVTALRVLVADAGNVADYINTAIGQKTGAEELGFYIWKECSA